MTIRYLIVLVAVAATALAQVPEPSPPADVQLPPLVAMDGASAHAAIMGAPWRDVRDANSAC